MIWNFYFLVRHLFAAQHLFALRPVLLLFVVVFCCLFATSLFSQSRRVDSLTGLLASSLPDTQRINTLCELSNHLLVHQPMKAKDYATEALQLAEKWDYLEGKTNALYALGNVYWKQQEKEKAIYYLGRALQIAQHTDNQILLYKTTNILKGYYRAKKQYDSLVYYYDINVAAEEQLSGKDKARIVKALAEELHNEALKQKEIEWLQKENLHKEQIIAQQKIIEYSLGGGLLMLSILSLVLYKNYRQKQQLRFNKQMEEIGDIASHNLRAPVASILGLLNIYNRRDPADIENQAVLEHLDVSAKKLDEIVREIVKKTYFT